PTTGGSPASYTVTSNQGQTCTAIGTRTCTITGLPYGIYFFTVTATNSAGTGPASAQSNGLIYADPPDAPTGATATAGAGQATVSWTTPDSYNGMAITSYTVTSSGGQTCVATAPTLTCTVTGLTGGISYTFTVTATNGVGTSAASNVSNTVTPTAPTGTPAPTPTCTASVSTQSIWMSGSNGYAQIMVNVTNSGTVATKGWKVTITWPKAMTIVGSVANGSATGSSTTSFVITNASYNGAIAVGASVPSTSGNDQRPNFQVYGSGAYAAPTSVSCSAT
ncbi:MAG: fibronectin type III domain-containing protein, partial [Candidatus Limnocylindrales bacterium]